MIVSENILPARQESMNDTMPCVPHAVAIAELARITAADPSITNLVNLAQFCATYPVVEAIAHGAALVREEVPADEWMDHCAREVATALVRACGVLYGAMFDGERGFVVVNEIANLAAAMEEHVDGMLLAAPEAWDEVAALGLRPEWGCAWWCEAYADRLAAAS